MEHSTKTYDAATLRHLSSLCWECVAQWLSSLPSLALPEVTFFTPHIPTGQLLPISQTRKEAPIIHTGMAARVTRLQVGLPFPPPDVVFHTWGAASPLKEQAPRELTPPSYAC